MKKELGQFYTNKNIFKNKVFVKWFKNIPLESRKHILEPFAGKNGIIKMLQELKLVKQYSSYDIAPKDPHVHYRDTIENFPGGFSLVITNPPFLAKNSITRRNLAIDLQNFNDSYELCLKVCLENCDYVAAIIPESFLVTDLFKDRLEIVISLAQRHIFKDTEHPVCLALFGNSTSDNYLIYKNEKLVGDKLSLSKEIEQFFKVESFNYNCNYNVKYNQPHGNVGLIAIDATDCTKQIRFVNGQDILSEDVNATSRLRTRFHITGKNNKELTQDKINKIIMLLNKNLSKYRKISGDVELTAFKGMRDDGSYRRRLDFTTARQLVELTLSKI